ncbi:hypothetical protein Y032_0090g2392 [Ancylostoma ceylanicum]|uniref:Uncharacterized protein n=1 Tax=Ancylostoma ceylanicum TaxID=53326 RepID=A0A016TNP8_9BILA|nr:hypothetical protein Y032_0090g2392 [Ancylostoma ceylanicum]
MYFKFQKGVENPEKYGVLWILEFSASRTRRSIPQWKQTEGTAWFSNTEIVVLSIISISILNFSPLPFCLRSGKLVHAKITFSPKSRVY